MMNAKTIMMYALIALGLALLVTPRDVMVQYAPDFLVTLDPMILTVAGVGCLGGAYFMYRQSKSAGSPPAYTPSDFDSSMTPSLK